MRTELLGSYARLQKGSYSAQLLVIFGCTTLEQLDDALSAADFQLSDEIIEEIEEIEEAHKANPLPF